MIYMAFIPILDGGFLDRKKEPLDFRYFTAKISAANKNFKNSLELGLLKGQNQKKTQKKTSARIVQDRDNSPSLGKNLDIEA